MLIIIPTCPNYAIFVLENSEGVLVRVVGNLREYDSKFNLMVFDVSPVIDWNELSYHLLEVIYTHLQNTQGPIPV